MQDENKNFDTLENSEKRISAVLKKLFPELAFRMAFLENLKNNWPSIVRGNISRFTRPFDIRGGILYINADTPQAAQMLLNMKGNMKRACSKVNLNDIKIVQGHRERKIIPVKNFPVKNQRAKFEIIITEDEVQNEINSDLNKINPEAAYAIAHLKIFFEKRFQNRKLN